jgi:hypothetical protein
MLINLWLLNGLRSYADSTTWELQVGGEVYLAVKENVYIPTLHPIPPEKKLPELGLYLPFSVEVEEDQVQEFVIRMANKSPAGLAARFGGR